MAACALFTNTLKLNAGNREPRLRHWLQWWKMAIRSERREKKMIRQVDFERRSLGDMDMGSSLVQEAVWGKQTARGEEELSRQLKEPVWQNPGGLPKCEALGFSTGKDQEAHCNWQLGEIRMKYYHFCNHTEMSLSGEFFSQVLLVYWKLQH